MTTAPSAPHAVDDGYIPAYILRNVGAPITLYRLDENGQPFRVGDEDTEWVTEKLHLRFDSNAVAALEDAFDGVRAIVPLLKEVPVTDGSGGLVKDVEGKTIVVREVVGSEERVFYGVDAFQKSLEIKPFRTCRDAMAIAMGTTPEVMGRRMIPERALDYQGALGAAWAIAQGVDPTQAARMLKEITDAAAERNASLESRFEMTTNGDGDAPGGTPGNPG